MDKGSIDPFGISIFTYGWVIAIAACAGLIKYLNSMQQFFLGRALIEVVTSGFTGVMTFWICQWGNLEPGLLPFVIAVSGLMGNRAWVEFENFLRSKFPASLQPTHVNHEIANVPDAKYSQPESQQTIQAVDQSQSTVSKVEQ